MFLTELSQIDERYTEYDEQCKILIHKIFTYENIRKFFSKYDREDFVRLCEAFPTVRNHGYDLNEAMTMDLTIVHR